MIWVEILSRHRDVAHRARFVEPGIRIGRGYDNDVIVDDPYVAAQHLRIERQEDGRLAAVDLGSLNGTFLDRERMRRERVVIDGDRPIRIGHTYLRIREAAHAVPTERSGRPETGAWPIALAVMLASATLGIEALWTWFGETGEPKASTYVIQLLVVAGAITGWVLNWTAATR